MLDTVDGWIADANDSFNDNADSRVGDDSLFRKAAPSAGRAASSSTGAVECKGNTVATNAGESNIRIACGRLWMVL